MTPDGCACIRQKFNRNQRFLHRTCIYHFGWPVLIASWVCLSSFTERHQEAGRYHIKRATKAQVRTYESLIEITHVGVHRTTLKSDLMSKYNDQNKGVGLAHDLFPESNITKCNTILFLAHRSRLRFTWMFIWIHILNQSGAAIHSRMIILSSSDWQDVHENLCIWRTSLLPANRMTIQGYPCKSSQLQELRRKSDSARCRFSATPITITITTTTLLLLVKFMVCRDK